MQKKILKSLIIVFFVPFLVKAEWIPLDKRSASPEAPVVQLLNDDNYSTVLRFDISGFELTDLMTEGKKYNTVDLLTESFTTSPGSPALPYVAKIMALHDQASVSVEILETGPVQIFSNICLPPARASWLEGDPETPYIEDQKVYSSGKSLPGVFAKMDPPGIFRDFRIARISVYPVQYIPAKKEIQVVSSVTVRINYGGGDVVNPKTTPRKPIAPSFGSIYRELLVNYQSVLDKFYDGKEDGHELMLCIMPDEFYPSFLPYAEWKRLSGIDIHITKFSDIGANANDPAIIKNHVTDAYHNWEVPPTYVLIVGDNGVFPKYIVNYSWSFPNEDYFVEIDGNDYFPEMFIGRLTNQSNYQMQVMINKFQKYEKNPYITNTDWFKKATVCSNDAYISQVQTKRFTAEIMLEEGNFTSVDTMMSDPGCTYNLTDVVNAINEGRSYLNYRGEGWSSGWGAYCYPFSTSDVTNLNNGEHFTFVTSIGCGVAMFDASGGNCFGEEWIEVGTLSNPKGAAAFIGPTSNTHTAYNNQIDKGIYIGMFHEGLETPGQALVRGKFYMYTQFGNEYYVEYHYRIYCILGDPSIHIWKDVPQAVTVEYPATIPFGFNLVEFTVTHTSTGLPVENAVVCVTGDELFSSASTDALGKAYVEIDAQVLETLDVTVRGGNVYPFQGTMIVIQPTGPYVVEDSYTIDDATGGNGNGLMDYGETILLSLTMKNVGVDPASNVTVALSTLNPYITFTDNTEFYGNIAAGSTAFVADGFSYTVADNIPDHEMVSIEVIATSGTDNWISYISIEAHAPVIEYIDFTLDDPAGNNNGKFDPGETVELTVLIENSGSSDALNVVGTMEETDPFVVVNTTQMDFGNISGGAQATAVYSVTAAMNTPAGHLAELNLILNADLGITASGEVKVVIGQVPVLILDLDENGNSAPDMEAALNTMDVTYEVLSAFPPELNLYSTIFLCLGVYPQNHVLTGSEGQILVDYLNDGGSLYMEGGDTWYFDPSTPVHSMFNINPTGDGSGDMDVVEGMAATFTQDMSFDYSGDNSWMDHIEPISPAFKIFDNSSPQYGTGVAYDAGNYKTIGASHEFGGLDDGASPSTKAKLMAQYLDFLGIIVTLQAAFTSDVTQVCVDHTVDFYDFSTGEVISWEWTFEGGSPPTSVMQNPTVYYSSPGSYDVSLTVSDGEESSTLTLTDYITVVTAPGIPAEPAGPNVVCGTEGISPYSTTGLPGISTYDWVINPASAGTIAGSGISIIVLWTSGFTGDVTLKVAGVNECGSGAYSPAIDITRYLPDVTLEPFNAVCVDDPPFVLTGGMPEGGEYSGAGVTGGWFYPATAGTGTHTITYTYTDPEDCQNFAVQTILVDPCTGLNENGLNGDFLVYPNPGNGMFMLKFRHANECRLTVFNTVNEMVFADKIQTCNKYLLDLSAVPAGFYYLHITSETGESVRKIVVLE
jgi:PKD repeat protein